MRELERKELKTLNICNEKYLLSITYDDRMIFQKKIQQEILSKILFSKKILLNMKSRVMIIILLILAMVISNKTILN